MGEIIKVISLWQPWASLAALELKENETRGWSTNYRGPLAIHAAKKIVPSHQLFDELTFAQRYFIMQALCEAYGDYDKMPTGAILSTCNLTSIYKTEEVRDKLTWLERACGDYSDGRLAWKLADMNKLEKPIPIKGHQGLWNIDSEVLGL